MINLIIDEKDIIMRLEDIQEKYELKTLYETFKMILLNFEVHEKD